LAYEIPLRYLLDIYAPSNIGHKLNRWVPGVVNAVPKNNHEVTKALVVDLFYASGVCNNNKNNNDRAEL